MVATVIPYKFNSLKTRNIFIDVVQRKGFQITNISERPISSKAKASNSWIPGEVNIESTETKYIYEVFVSKELEGNDRFALNNLAWLLETEDPWKSWIKSFFGFMIGMFVILFLLAYFFPNLGSGISLSKTTQDIFNKLFSIIWFIVIPLFGAIYVWKNNAKVINKAREVVENYFGKESVSIF